MGFALTANELAPQPPQTVPGELDAATVLACKQGDARALRRFVVRYQNLVFAFLSRSMGAGPHVEDMAQEVFLRAYRALPRFELREDARMSTWLLTIATRLVLDARRRKHIQLVPLSETPTPSHQTPETEHQRRQIVAAFENAALQLADDHRIVFVLAHFHGRTMAEIAALLEIPENTVKTRLHRARHKLRELLRTTREATSP